MGLDQYAFVTTNTLEELNDETFKQRKLSEVWYGRKINPLQGFFEEHYNLENCGFVELTPSIIETIQIFAWEDYCAIKSILTDEEIHYIEKEEYNARLEKHINEKIKYHEGFEEDRQWHLPPTQGFFYGNYEINIHYCFDLLTILDFCASITQNFKNLHQYERLVYTCWY